MLRDNNYEPEFRLPGSLWMRELFMKAQTNILQLNMPIFLSTALLLSSSHLIATLVFDSKKEDWDWIDSERDTDRTIKWWVFNLTIVMNTFIFTVLQALFLWFAFWDANRRIYLMKQVSNCLEMDFVNKDEITVRLPTLNFMD